MRQVSWHNARQVDALSATSPAGRSLLILPDPHFFVGEDRRLRYNRRCVPGLT